jgi:hypothetical protein
MSARKQATLSNFSWFSSVPPRKLWDEIKGNFISVFKYYVITYGGVEVQLHVLLGFTLDGHESASFSCRFNHGEISPQLYKRLGGLQNRSGRSCFCRESNHDSSIFQSAAWSI